MRWLHMTIVAVLAAATRFSRSRIFKSVTVAFLGLRFGAPLAVLIAAVYVLGMATGGSLWALFRWALEGAKRPAAP
jgi:hypothetical protein